MTIPDLLHPVPLRRIDLEETKLSVALAFAAGVSGGLFAEAPRPRDDGALDLGASVVRERSLPPRFRRELLQGPDRRPRATGLHEPPRPPARPASVSAGHRRAPPGDHRRARGGAAASVIDLMDDPYERGHESGMRAPLPLAHVRFTEEATLTGRTLPDAFPPIAALPDVAPVVPLVLDEGMRNGELVFTVNDATYPDVPHVLIEKDGLRILEVKNASEMDHPFHLHGFFFQVLEKNGVRQPLQSMGNKDTIVIPGLTTVKLVARFDELGHWMYHCHILEHAEGGMMGEVHGD